MHLEAVESLESSLGKLDAAELKQQFTAQDEFVFVENFLPPNLLETLLGELDQLDGAIHRNYIPKHKKGGSICRYDLERLAPIYRALYQSRALVEYLSHLCGATLDCCPASDPHSFALYYYTEPGDHIGYHYDTSYYAGARYTVLLGLEEAPSCKLECRLHTRNPAAKVETLSLSLKPGMFVFFNGDKLHHRITPLATGERRVALTLEYLTDARMNPLLRFVSNMKDAIAYFGFKQVFNRKTPEPGE